MKPHNISLSSHTSSLRSIYGCEHEAREQLQLDMQRLCLLFKYDVRTV